MGVLSFIIVNMGLRWSTTGIPSEPATSLIPTPPNMVPSIFSVPPSLLQHSPLFHADKWGVVVSTTVSTDASTTSAHKPAAKSTSATSQPQVPVLSANPPSLQDSGCSQVQSLGLEKPMGPPVSLMFEASASASHGVNRNIIEPQQPPSNTLHTPLNLPPSSVLSQPELTIDGAIDPQLLSTTSHGPAIQDLPACPANSQVGSPSPPPPDEHCHGCRLVHSRSRSTDRTRSSSRAAVESRASSSSRERMQTQGKKRIRVSQQNPKFGYVEGAMMGTVMMKIPRNQDVCPPQNDLAKAKKHFTRVMGMILSRAKRLAEETDCWLITIGQQPGKGPAVHYTSSRLHHEAHTEATAIVNQFQQLTYTLNLARTRDAVHLQTMYKAKLQEEHESRDMAQKKADTAQEELRHIHEERGANLSMIEKLKAELESLCRTQPPQGT
ncbi:unnamed protein product [Cyclocybe aegerita]|uniref:Uncharacterized protein n=1 Tax=Cyclocybe aegerita TaxID=1973307 RepID=A0A8S0WTN2_CYCAE|nr:unnamed protein product [Cyclocybe aegerita]